jgi:DNA-binding transcriptional MerR regulator
MLKIGDFSRLSGISIKTLRYYDDLGLLKPAEVDPFTGYRYYSARQLPRLYRLLALKDLGFSLEQVAHLLTEGVSADQLRGMLRLRQAEQQQRVDEEQQRLTRVALRLRLIEMETTMPNYDVILKNTPPQWIASARQVIANYKSVGQLYPQVFSHLARHNVAGGLSVALWHDGEAKDSEVDAEAGIYLDQGLPSGEGVAVYQLPALTVASVVHHGAYQRLVEAYDAALRWVEANGYRVAGPIRELYLVSQQPVRQDDESYVTEIQFPVEKDRPAGL